MFDARIASSLLLPTAFLSPRSLPIVLHTTAKLMATMTITFTVQNVTTSNKCGYHLSYETSVLCCALAHLTVLYALIVCIPDIRLVSLGQALDQ